MTPPRLVVFDFDGVVADSELAANTNLAATLTSVGMPTTLDESLDYYLGHHWDDCVARITQRWGRPPPLNLRELRAARWGSEIIGAISPVPGVARFIERLGSTPRAIASSSRAEWIETMLASFGLLESFAPNIFSAPRDVSRGKPHPDIYEHAMRTLGFTPNETWVIEDTPIGVRAGVASGATVIGLCAGTHIRSGHAEVLRAAGAHHIAESYSEVASIMGV